MESLAEIYQRHKQEGDFGSGDKGTTHSYIGIYEKILAPYRNGCVFMEIGLARGLSLAMWGEYLHNSTLVGVDRSIVFDTEPHRRNGALIFQADATKPELLKYIEGLKFDVVIDDASHMEADQIATFKMLAPKMKKGGIYVVEDVINLEMSLPNFSKLGVPMDVYDRRKVKGYQYDVMIVFKF